VSDDGQIILLIQDAKEVINDVKNYLMVLRPNYKRGNLYKYGQYLVGITEVVNSGIAFALSVAKNDQGRNIVKILLNNGV
jgi:hypothetical protein